MRVEEYIDEELKFRDNAPRTLRRLTVLARRLRAAKRTTISNRVADTDMP